MKKMIYRQAKDILQDNQSGFILVVVLVFLVAMTTFGLIAMNNSKMEKDVGANEKVQAEVFYDAESTTGIAVSLLEQNIEYKGFTTFEANNEIGDVWVHPLSYDLYMNNLAEKMANHDNLSRTNATYFDGNSVGFSSLDSTLLTNNADDDSDGDTDEPDESINAAVAVCNDQSLVGIGQDAAGTQVNIEGAFRDGYFPAQQTVLNPGTPGMQTASLIIWEETTVLKAGGEIETNMGYHQRGVNRGGGAEILYDIKSHAEGLLNSRKQIHTQWLHVIK